MTWQNPYRALTNRYRPQSAEEERAMIAAERHDKERLCDLLVFHNMAAAMSVAKTYGTARMDSLEDATQRAMIGLYKASRDFDIDCGVKFLSYASWRMIQAVTYPYNLCDANTNAKMVSLDEPLSTRVHSADGDTFTRYDAIRSLVSREIDLMNDGRKVVDKMNGDDWRTLVFRIVDSCVRFSESHRKMFRRYLELWSYQAVATEFGVTREMVRQVVDKVARVVRMKLGERYSHDGEIARLLARYRKHKEEAEWQSPAYREAVGTNDRLKREEEYIEAVRQERPSGREALLSRLRASLYSDAFQREGVADIRPESVQRRKAYSSRSCARLMNYDRLDGTRQRKVRTTTRWLPDSTDRYLNELFSQERLRYKARHQTSEKVSIGDQRRKSFYHAVNNRAAALTASTAEAKPPAPIMDRRYEDEPTEQDLFTSELEARLARMDERQTAQGNHFDDIYELQDAS